MRPGASPSGHDDTFTLAYKQAKVDGDTTERERLKLLRRDAGSFARMYDFLSQVVDHESTDLVTLVVFLRQLVRAIATD